MLCRSKGTSTKPDSTFIYSFSGIDVTESGTVKAVAYDARDEVVAEEDVYKRQLLTELKKTAQKSVLSQAVSHICMQKKHLAIRLII